MRSSRSFEIVEVVGVVEIVVGPPSNSLAGHVGPKPLRGAKTLHVIRELPNPDQA